MRKDPLDRLRKHLVFLGLVAESTDEALDRELAAEIAEAILEVEKLPAVERESLVEDVYAELPWHLREQRRELEELQMVRPGLPT